MAKDKAPSREKAEFQHEALQSPDTLGQYLAALQEGFASGALSFTNERGEITLKPSGLVRFEIDASMKRGRARLTLRFEWKEQTKPGPDDAGFLRINGEEE